MNDGDRLYRAILEDPFDDSPRLLYADWLDDRGEAERAEFIRAQVAYAKMPNRCAKTGKELSDGTELTDPKNYVKRCRCDVCKERRRAYVAGCSKMIDWDQPSKLHGEYVRAWVRAKWKTNDIDTIFGDHYRVSPPIRISTRWRRGFASSIMMGVEHFQGFAKEIFSRWPVVDVHFRNYGSLSEIAVNFGRELAGLPPLKWPA